ncbi:bifunctional folylpolyglutamate synthase/dihydrofolate synthase [Campylobacter sp.]|uniref:bifunctional folylpolyglutamate synthase/dihydrofolate synthase n=1 Tax=Campylobacter sp. TaxID=205 RepID=UPI00270E9C5B|nr:Mur ligase family protein [Campylobacter sp.]
MKLDEFLSHKPLFYKEIDYTRMPRAWQSIKDKIKPFKIIHIIGTNGKGSTGRFLAQILHLHGKSVGHYTSPHIFEFRERFWLNGQIVKAEILEDAHSRLQSMLSSEFSAKTSYFEYATLLAATLFSQCDYFVCETGMGGEFDATNVFDKLLSLFTPIGLDHVGVLGNSIKEISTTKFNAVSCGVRTLLNDDMDKLSVEIGRDIASKKGVKLEFASEILEESDKETIKIYSSKFALAEFLTSNLTLAAAASKIILGKFDISNLSKLNLRGRCEQVSDNVWVDVGHNELAALAVVKKFKDERLTLIYNSFIDKDFKAVLKALRPIINEVEIYEYESLGRELATDKMAPILDELGLAYRKFKGLSLKEAQKSDKKYLVFGSFYLVESFLRQFDAS